MTDKKHNLEEVKSTQRELVQAAESLLSGKSRLSSTSLIIQRLLCDLGDDMNIEFRIFTALNSETDCYPIGRE